MPKMKPSVISTLKAVKLMAAIPAVVRELLAQVVRLSWADVPSISRQAKRERAEG